MRCPGSRTTRSAACPWEPSAASGRRRPAIVSLTLRTWASIPARFWARWATAPPTSKSSPLRAWLPATEAEENAYLLKGDHVRAGQRYGSRFQGFVRQVRVARIQDIIETDRRLVAAAGRGRIHRNDHGAIPNHRADRCVGHLTADLPADQDQRLDALRLQ